MGSTAILEMVIVEEKLNAGAPILVSNFLIFCLSLKSWNSTDTQNLEHLT